MSEREVGDEETRRIAIGALIEAYWKPAYKYLRLKWSLDADEAADLTQEFFTSALEKEVVEKYDPARARFRTYLRLCLDGFASNARKAERRLKRGGGVTMVPLDFENAEGELASHEPAVDADVDELFYREWVRALLERSVADLKRHAEALGRPEMFEVFARYDLVDESETRPTYTAIASALNLTTATVTNHLAAMRRQFRKIVLDRLRDLTSSEEEWEAEAARLSRSGKDKMISDRAIDRLREAASWPELDARYEITGVAGHGGMGTVYVARDHVLDREVAVKVLDIADHEGSRARAGCSAKRTSLRRLDHPGIVPVHDAGTLADGRAFYVMKLVKGRRLDDLIRDRHAAREPADCVRPHPRCRRVRARARRRAPRPEARERHGRRLRRGLRDGLGRRAGRRRRRAGGGRHARIHAARAGSRGRTSIRAPTSTRSACCSRT